ncbi:MAG: RNA polymerase sigma factor [Xanthomonadaceae bacterium]|jgi:RNA polymerase sigma-70 factor (ECF subfamily)|nr:RNA polymerase sigma factor [Xanthomonadaceae bacterium]
MPPGDSRIEALLRTHEPRLRALFARHLGGRPGIDLDDLVQEARIRLWKALEREKNVDALASYIQRVVTSVVVDALRRKAARPEDTVEEPLMAAAAQESGAPEDTLAHAQRAAALREALARIPERRRRPAALLLQGFSTPEIARLLDTTEATVRNLAYRGVDDLKALLGGGAPAEMVDD